VACCEDWAAEVDEDEEDALADELGGGVVVELCCAAQPTHRTVSAVAIKLE
jgi:hypothetical protein